MNKIIAEYRNPDQFSAVHKMQISVEISDSTVCYLMLQNTHQVKCFNNIKVKFFVF